MKQINNLCTGIKLAVELKSNSNLRKFLIIEGYKYNSNNQKVELDKFITNNKLYDTYFELKIYEISISLNINNWNITKDDFENKIVKKDIKGIKELEIILSNYVEDYSTLKPEWYCENLPWI